MQRHLLEPVGSVSVPEVVRRLGAVLATDEGAAVVAVGARCARPQPNELERAFADGEVIKVFAFRGAVHYLSAADGGAYLALRSAGRQWELASWQKQYKLSASDWPAFRESVRAAMEEGPCSVAELGAAVTGEPSYRHLREVFDDDPWTLLKPLMWQGDMSFAPPREGKTMFQRLEDNPGWAGIWDLDDAGPHAIRSYLRSYGPTTYEHIHYWLGEGLSAGRKRLQRWLADMEGTLAPVDVEGQSAYVLTEDLEELMAAQPNEAVRLLSGHDQWVMGPGTKDEHVVPPAHRAAMTRKANPVVVGGVVSGTWHARHGQVEVTWFNEHDVPSRQALQSQVETLAIITDRPHTLTSEMT